MIQKSTKQKSVLVIEDDRSLLAVISAKLKKSGFAVISARSVDHAFGAEFGKKRTQAITITSIEHALKYLESLERVDAIWLDHHLLGKEDGLDFVRKFKANGGRWGRIPVFVVSNAASPKTVQSYTASGVTNYYVKSDHRLDEIIADIQVAVTHTKRPHKKV